MQVNSYYFIESRNKEEAQAQQAPLIPTTQQTKEQNERADFVKDIIEINDDDVIPF